MDFTRLNDRLAVGPQITVADLKEIEAAGFRSIICNRPDGEGPGQPGQAEIAAEAHARGLAFRYIPVTPGQLGDDAATEFGLAVHEMPAPVFAYCRSGARARALHDRARALSSDD